MERLYEFSNALLGLESNPSREDVARNVAGIPGIDGVALYLKSTGQISRFGSDATAITGKSLLESATSGFLTGDKSSAFFVAPIRQEGELVGSIGISGANMSKLFIGAIAGHVGLGLARLEAIEKSTEAEVVRRSEELKSALLDAMAHEIRTPLNSVKIAVNVLLSDRISSEQQKETLTILDEEVDRIDHFIDEAAQLANVDANRLFLKKSPQDIVHLIPVAIEDMGAAAKHRRIEMRVPESLPPVECDEEMLVHVLKQLLNNALKYSSEDSPITVSAESTGAIITIDVVDCGPGVPADERDRIFEKHYRGNAVRSIAPGTGLGLASVKCIVQAHGGSVWVTDAPGGGAAFHISLPVARASRTVGATQ